MIRLYYTDAVMNILRAREGKLDPALLDNLVARATEDTAGRSCCQFKKTDAGDYACTVLGLINGILPELTGKYLVKKVDKDTGQLVGFEIVKKASYEASCKDSEG